MANQSVQIKRDTWIAFWNGRQSTATFNCKGAADAWIAICERTGKFRS